MSGEYIEKYVVVMPTYSSVFGCSPTLKDLIDIIKQNPVFEWLGFLSRIQSVIGADRFQRRENQLDVFHGVFSERLQNLILYSQNSRNKLNLHICYERQLSTLQQLVILHAPDTGDGSLESEDGRENLGLALLMVNDLMRRPNPQNDDTENIIAALIQETIRIANTPYWIYLARAFRFYELETDQPGEKVHAYISLFEKAVAVNAHDFLLGGLIVAVQERIRSNQDQANSWQRVLPLDQRKNVYEKLFVEAFEKQKCADIEKMRTTINKFEDGLLFSDWNLISLSIFPLVTFPQAGTFILNLSALGRGLFDGVRHAILTAASEKRLPETFNSVRRVGGLYGEVFEKYIQDLLQTAFPKRVVKIPENDFPGNADFLIIFPGKIVVIEVKSEHFVTKHHYKLMTIRERQFEIESVGLKKAVGQIESTIKALRNFNLKPLGLGYYDWTTTPIIPLVVTDEEYPLFPQCWRFLYEEVEKPLMLLNSGVGPVGRLRILSIDEVEMLPDLTGSIDFATLLLQWGSDPSKFEYPFRNYLLECNQNHVSNDFMYKRWREVCQTLADRLGFDTLKI